MTTPCAERYCLRPADIRDLALCARHYTASRDDLRGRAS